MESDRMQWVIFSMLLLLGLFCFYMAGYTHAQQHDPTMPEEYAADLTAPGYTVEWTNVEAYAGDERGLWVRSASDVRFVAVSELGSVL